MSTPTTAMDIPDVPRGRSRERADQREEREPRNAISVSPPPLPSISVASGKNRRPPIRRLNTQDNLLGVSGRDEVDRQRSPGRDIMLLLSPRGQGGNSRKAGKKKKGARKREQQDRENLSIELMGFSGPFDTTQTKSRREAPNIPAVLTPTSQHAAFNAGSPIQLPAYLSGPHRGQSSSALSSSLHYQASGGIIFSSDSEESERYQPGSSSDEEEAGSSSDDGDSSQSSSSSSSSSSDDEQHIYALPVREPDEENENDLVTPNSSRDAVQRAQLPSPLHISDVSTVPMTHTIPTVYPGTEETPVGDERVKPDARQSEDEGEGLVEEIDGAQEREVETMAQRLPVPEEEEYPAGHHASDHEEATEEADENVMEDQDKTQDEGYRPENEIEHTSQEDHLEPTEHEAPEPEEVATESKDVGPREEDEPHGHGEGYSEAHFDAQGEDVSSDGQHGAEAEESQTTPEGQEEVHERNEQESKTGDGQHVAAGEVDTNEGPDVSSMAEQELRPSEEAKGETAQDAEAPEERGPNEGEHGEVPHDGTVSKKEENVDGEEVADHEEGSRRAVSGAVDIPESPRGGADERRQEEPHAATQNNEEEASGATEPSVVLYKVQEENGEDRAVPPTIEVTEATQDGAKSNAGPQENVAAHSVEPDAESETPTAVGGVELPHEAAVVDNRSEVTLHAAEGELRRRPSEETDEADGIEGEGSHTPTTLSPRSAGGEDSPASEKEKEAAKKRKGKKKEALKEKQAPKTARKKKPKKKSKKKPKKKENDDGSKEKDGGDKDDVGASKEEKPGVETPTEGDKTKEEEKDVRREKEAKQTDAEKPSRDAKRGRAKSSLPVASKLPLDPKSIPKLALPSEEGGSAIKLPSSMLQLGQVGQGLLFRAITRGNIKQFKSLIEQMQNQTQSSSGPTDNYIPLVDELGISPLHRAAFLGRVDFVTAVLESHLYDTLLVDGDGCTCLHNAVCSNSCKCMEIIMHHTALTQPTLVDTLLNKKDTQGFTALHLTCFFGRHKCLEYLLSYYARQNEPECGDGDAKEAIPPKSNAADDVLSQDKGETKGEASAVPTGNKREGIKEQDGPATDSAENMAEKGPAKEELVRADGIETTLAHLDVCATDNEGMTGMHWAVCKGHSRITKTLLDATGSVLICCRNNLGRTPVHEACAKGLSDILTLLLTKFAMEKNTELDCSRLADANGDTPLHLAVSVRSKDCVLSLLQRAVSPQQKYALVNTRNLRGQTSVHTACREGDKDLLEILVKTVQGEMQEKALVHGCDHSRDTPLHIAAVHGADACAEYLLANGADIGASNSMGKTPLHLAAAHGFKSCVALLVSNNADVLREDAADNTPLHLAAMGGHAAVVSLLISLGSHFSEEEKRKFTAVDLRKMYGMMSLSRIQAELKSYSSSLSDSGSIIKLANNNNTLISPARSPRKVQRNSLTLMSTPTKNILDYSEVHEELAADFGMGLALFNGYSAKKGINYLMTKKFVGSSPQAVARFLTECPHLNKAKIGEFLGENSPFSRATLKAVVERMDFSELDFDVAIRKLLAAFRLPGEAQQIDRVMKTFASHYFSQQTREGCVFADSDAVYVLAFSTIMLNTDAHNKNIKAKMTKSQFIKNNEGINGGQDLSKKFQEDLFHRIVDNEIIAPDQEVDVAWPNAIKKGKLEILASGNFSKSWRKTFTILEESKLHLFKKALYIPDTKPHYTLDMDMLEIGLKNTKGKPFCFLLCNKVATPRTRRGTFVHKRVPEFHLFACDDQNEQLAWFHAIKASMALSQEAKKDTVTATIPSAPMAPPSLSSSPLSPLNVAAPRKSTNL